MAARIRLLIVDDDERFLDALDAMLETADDVEVVGRATNGEEAFRLAGELMPDVITMDIDMPVMTGVQATRMITHYYGLPVVILSGSESGEMVQAALNAGAVAHVPKGQAWDALVPAVRSAAGRSRRH